MALKQNFSFSGIDVVDGYIKVSSVSGGKQNLSAQIEYSVSSEFQAVQTKSVSFVPSMSDVNFIKQAYEHLKTLPEFAGAVDC
jgi:hypothetical protein